MKTTPYDLHYPIESRNDSLECVVGQNLDLKVKQVRKVEKFDIFMDFSRKSEANSIVMCTFDNNMLNLFKMKAIV